MRKRPKRSLDEDPRFLRACADKGCARVDYAALAGLTGYTDASCRRALHGDERYRHVLDVVLARLGYR